VDEFGTNVAMTRRYGWALRGARCHSAVPFNGGRNITLTMGLRLDGFIAPFAFEGATNSVAFRAYIETQLAPALKRGDVVVVDNLSAHHAAGIEPVLAAVGAKLLFLPPYSPDLSPVENCGSKVKALMRAQAPRTTAAVYEAMGHAIGRVTPSDAIGWFGHCGYRTKRE
jgi:transposase